MREYTPEIINSLNKDEIFVFGSNTEGRHGKGSALIARQKFGAIYGQARGLQGQSYAIVTKDLSKGIRSVTLDSIFNELIDLFIFAHETKKYKKFYIVKIGSSLAGFTITEMKSLFEEIHSKAFIPNKIILPKEYEVRT